ncbi:MAG: F0F1 ATP synthase subunit B [Elusimicrobiota bacterium]|jgi:F-type H+-transporting ATPase subunit b|nr:F0F1 ATP synthase subunit B [Elusimicrobiota bacterium]
MEALLQPDIGLTFWTMVNFLILAFLLAKFAWKPVVNSLENREKKIAADVSSAQSAREEAEKIKKDLEAKMESLAKETSAKLKEAAALAEQEKQKLLVAAKGEAGALIDQARAQIEADTNKAIEAVKKEVVNTTMLAVKKVIGKEADAKTNAQLVEDLLKDIKAK